jgi:hypothetical protein
MQFYFLFNDIIGKGDTFPLFFNDNILILILAIPLFSIFFIFFTPGLGDKNHYIFSLYSTLFSFLVSLFL